jgi:hypothetical protein
MKTNPTVRPDAVLLLHPWSTATTQTTNSTIAQTPRTLNNMLHLIHKIEIQIMLAQKW